MSKTVDERVVSMQFDNRRFERNVKTSMGTIKKLKNSLNFEETSKSLEELDKQAKNVDMKTLSKNADSVKLKFTALQVVAVRALTRIADSAMNAGKRIVTSLSTDQISAGWSKFEQKTASVQTIMNSTGKSIDEVSKYLDTLMWYSDQTSYGFTDMTSALAQMTSAGGDIDKIIPLIMGVANATAFAGKGAAEFSRVMYNLNQSYSLGYLQSLDWKSLEFAGAASKQLKQTLIDVGRELGKIGDEVTVDNFMTTLATRWADKEVMEKAFGRFAVFTQAVKDAVDRGEYETAEEAIAALSDKYEELGVKAFTAAQEAKSFSEAMNAVKDAVSSGWMQSFEIIFGNYQEAKKVWSSVYNMLYDTFASGIDTRNEILTKVFAKSGWDDIIDQGIINEEAYTNTIIKNAKKLKFPIEELIKQEGSLQNVISKGLIPVDILDKSIIDLADSYSLLSDEDLKTAGYTREQIENFRKLADGIKDGKVSLDEFYENIDKLSGRDLLLESINNIFEAASNVVNIVKEAFNEVFMPFDNDEKAQKIYNLIEALKLFTEKLKLTEEQSSKLKNVFKGLFDVVDVILYILKTVKNILYETIKSTFGLGKGILDVVSSIGKFLSSIAGLIKKSTILKNIFDTIKNILVIITDITITLTKMVLGPLSNIIDFINNLFNDFGTTIAEIGKTAKEFYNNFVDVIKESKIFRKIIESIQNIFKNVINIVAEVGKTIFKLFSKVFSLKISFEAIGEAISYAAKCISKFATSIINVIKESKFVETIFGSLKISIELLIKFIIQIFSTLGTVLKATFGSIYGFIEFVTNVFTNVLTFLTKVLSGIQKIFKIFIDSNVTVLEFIIGIFKNIWNFLESVLNKIINWFSNLVESFKNGSIKFTDVLKNVLIAGIISALTFLIVKLATLPVKALDSFFGGVGEACKAFTKSMKAIVNPLITIATAVMMLVASIIALTFIDKTKLREAMSIIVIIFGILSLMTKLIASTSIFSGIANFKTGYGIYKALSSIKNIAFALLLIVPVLSILSSINKDKLLKGLLSMIAILGTFNLVILSLSKIQIDNILDIYKKVNVLYNLSFALITMSIPLKILGTKDWNKFGTSLISITVILGLFTLLLFVLKQIKIDKIFDIHKKIGVLYNLSLALVALTIPLKILASTDWSKISDKELYILAGIITALAAVVTALSLIGSVGSKGNKTKIGLKNLTNTISNTNTLLDLDIDTKSLSKIPYLISVSALLISLAGSIVLLVESYQKIGLKGLLIVGAILTVLLGIIVGFMGSVKALAPNIKGSLSAIAYISIISGFILILAESIALLANSYKKVGVKDLLIVGAILTVLLGIIVGFAASIKTLAPNVKTSWSAITYVAIMSGLILLLAGNITLLVNSYQKIGVKGLLIVEYVLATLLGIIIGFIASIRTLVTGIKASWSAIGYISIMSGLILSLTGSMLLLSLIDWKKVLSASVAILAIGLVLSGLMATLMMVKKLGNNEMQSKTLIEFAGSIAILSSSLMLLIAPLLALSMLNWPQILSGLAGMAVVLISLTAAASIISKTKADESLKSLANALLKISLAVIAITSSILIVALAIKLLGDMISETTIKKIAEIAAAIGAAIVSLLLSILATLADSMPQLVAILVKIFYYLNEAIVKIVPIITKGILDIIIKVLDQLIVYIPLVIAKILDLVIKITNTLALYIPKLLISTVLDFIATVLENVLKSVIKYIVEFLTRIVDEVKNIDPNFLVNLLDSLKCINSIMLQLIESSLLIPLAMPAAVALLTFIGELTLILGAIYKLNEWFNLESIANNVSSVLKAIGKAIGNFIGGILGGITASFSLIALPALGTALSNFMINLKEFITGLESIKPDSIKNGMDLIKLITIITTTSFINSIFDFVSSFTGNDSMTKFADNIVKFGNGLKEFDKSTKNIDANKVKKASESGVLLAEMTEKISKEGGLAQVFCGTTDFGKFATNIATYGEALKSFEESTKGMSFDQVEPAARAGRTFAEMVSNIPNTDGWMQTIEGFPNFEKFSKNIGLFGLSLKAFEESTLGMSFSTIEPAAKAGLAFADMVDQLPLTDGDIQRVVGFKNFESFNNNIAGFGESLLRFFNKISILGAYDLSRIEKASNSLFTLVDVFSNVYDLFIGEHANAFKIEEVYEKFPYMLTEIGSGIYEFWKALKDIDINNLDTVITVSDAFHKLFNSLMIYGINNYSEIVDGINVIYEYITKLSEAILNYYYTVKNMDANTLETKTKELFEVFNKTVTEFADPLRNNDLYTNFKDYGEYIGNAIMDGIRESLSKGMDLLDDGIGDNVIVIKPVLDLTNFKSGVSDMDNIISLRTPNRTINNANSINSIIEQNQNNGNGDLLSAIKGLSNKLDNLSGDTYNINGITYDDGSAVQDAIKTLVRAAKIKGRV